MMQKKYLITVAGIVTLSCWNPIPVYATSAVDQLLAEYRKQGAANFTAEAGQKLFFQEFRDKDSGQVRKCTSCHTEDLRNPGKHAKTGKSIDPLAPSTNPQSLTDLKEINKWLKRNCEWTLGRECTPQEKGEALVFIQSQ
jgi:cytochrome c553